MFRKGCCILSSTEECGRLPARFRIQLADRNEDLMSVTYRMTPLAFDFAFRIICLVEIQSFMKYSFFGRLGEMSRWRLVEGLGSARELSLPGVLCPVMGELGCLRNREGGPSLARYRIQQLAAGVIN